MDTIYFYIHFTEFPERIVTSPTEYEELVGQVTYLLDRADCERGAVLSIEESNATQFVANLEALSQFEEFIGTYSSAEAITLVLQELSVQNWRDKQLHETSEWKKFYRHFSPDTKLVSDSCPDVLKETAERIAMNIQQGRDKLLIIDIGNSFPDFDHLSVIRGELGGQPQMINISKVNNFIELEKWIYANIPERSYNYSDNRHTEGHPDYIGGKSPILGGIGGKPRLAELLKKAIGDARQRPLLVNYDPENGAYIRYEYENVEHQNRYHGYHLVLPNTHEIDEREIRKLPHRIIKLLNYRLEVEK